MQAVPVCGEERRKCQRRHGIATVFVGKVERTGKCCSCKWCYAFSRRISRKIMLLPMVEACGKAKQLGSWAKLLKEKFCSVPEAGSQRANSHLVAGLMF